MLSRVCCVEFRVGVRILSKGLQERRVYGMGFRAGLRARVFREGLWAV